MRLSQKQEIFLQFFFAFLKSTLNFEHFAKKQEPHSCFITKIMDGKKALSINV